MKDAACSLHQTLCYNRAPFRQQFQRSFKFLVPGRSGELLFRWTA